MLWIIYQEDRDDAGDLRATYKDEHLAYLEKHEHVVLLAGAMLADDNPKRLGSAFVVNFPDRASVDAFSENEPFRKAGLFKTVKIARMRKGQFNPGVAPASAEGD
jgi:uncharacterized protein YciI